jgi:hypothetical protein
MIGFIITRNVNSEITNKYWKICVKQIRTFYPENMIVIIDDNSKQEYIDKLDTELHNCIIINSEFKCRGEMLPYYYYFKNKWFDKAVIIHDSVFINKYIDFDKVDDIKFIWNFNLYDMDHEVIAETRMIQNLDNKEELFNTFNNRKLWTGCFGAMSVISHRFLKIISEKYHFFVLLNHTLTKFDRCMIERLLAILCFTEKPSLIDDPSIFGVIYDYMNWGYTYDNYLDDLKCNKLDKFPLIKVWTGR